MKATNGASPPSLDAERHDVRVKAALDLLSEALQEQVVSDITRTTQPNLQGFLSAMVQYGTHTALANQQLLFAVNDLQISLRALIELLVAKGAFTNEDWIVARVAGTVARAQCIKESIPNIIAP